MQIQHVIHHHPCHRHSFRRGIERNGAEDVGGFHLAQPMVANVVAALFINLVLIHALLPSPLNLLVVPVLFVSKLSLQTLSINARLCSSSSSTYGCMECEFSFA
ncbi:hypothetical protein Gotur_024049 [Gossypium turneri]